MSADTVKIPVATDIPVAKPLGEQDTDQRTSLLGAAPKNSSAPYQVGGAGDFGYDGGVDIERQLRLGFLRKVYAILACQMLVTSGFVALFIYNDSMSEYVFNNSWILWTAMGVYLFTAFAIICCGEMRRKHPHGLICLSALTLAMSVMVGVISASYETQTVMWAAVMTCGCVAGLSAYACFTKRDFTMMGGLIASFLFVFIMSWFVLWWFPVTNTVNLIYSGLGALLMCFFIVYDTQLMLGGKHKLAISLDEYVFAALNLYLDIINLFLYLLQILGGGRR